MTKYIIKSSAWFLALWIAFSFLDYNFARTMYGGMHLTQCNIVVVMHNTLDNLLQGFIF